MQDQRIGYFGWQEQTNGAAPQPLYKAKVDIKRAVAESADLMDLWTQMQKYPEAPPFSGGVLDAWPAEAVDAIAIAREETATLVEHLRGERARAERKHDRKAG